jgi:hypothetical protein
LADWDHELIVTKDKQEIYCPRCEYRPKDDDRWDCLPSCGTTWHTFWTGGVCPGCGVKWPKTQCPSCDKISPHGEWYHYPEKEQEVAEEKALESQ